MEKLIELLNQYVEKYNKSDLDYTFELDKDDWLLFCYDDTTDYKWRTMQDEAMVICSKQFWFIKRLVDSDKIGEFSRKDVRYPYYLEDGLLLQGYGESDSLIMLLAISDNPIDLLCERLK